MKRHFRPQIVDEYEIDGDSYTVVSSVLGFKNRSNNQKIYVIFWYRSQFSTSYEGKSNVSKLMLVSEELPIVDLGSLLTRDGCIVVKVVGPISKASAADVELKQLWRLLDI